MWASAAHAQNQFISPEPFTSTHNTQTRPFNLIGTGVNLHKFTWNTQGTVSAGACALKGGSDGVTFGTIIIAAQTVTSSGGPTAITSGVLNYVRFECTTPIVGTGNVTFAYSGYLDGSASVASNVSIFDSTGGSITATAGSINANITGGSTGNGAASATGSAVPAQAGFNGLNVGGGTLRGQTGVNPTGSVYASQGDITSVNGISVNVGLGNASTGTQRIAVSNDSYESQATSDQSSTPGRVMVIAGNGSGGYLPLNEDNAGRLNVNVTTGAFTGNTTQIAGVSIVTGGIGGTQAVGGNVAAGSTVSSSVNPIPIAGSDYGGTPAIRGLKVDSSGSAAVAIVGTPAVSGSGTFTVSGAVTVSGTVTSNAGTNLNTSALALETGGNLAGAKSDLDSLTPAQASTTSGQKGTLVQCAVTTSAPTYTTAQTDPLSCDTAGSVRVSVVSGSTGNAAAGATGSAVPAQADYAGLNVGGTNRGRTGVNPSGSVYAAQTDLTSVAGTTALTGGVNGSIGIGGLAASAASVAGNPVYVGGNSGGTAAALSISVTGGGLKVDGSGYTQPISGSVTANAGAGPYPVGGTVASAGSNSGNPVKIAGVYNSSLPTVTTGQVVDAQANANGVLYVDASKTPPTGAVTAANSDSAIGALSANTTVVNAATGNITGTAMDISGYSSVGLTVNCSGCSGGTAVNFLISADGSNFVAKEATLQGATPTIATSTTTAGITVWQMSVAGFRNIRADVASYSAGTITVTATAVVGEYTTKTVNGNITQFGGTNVSTGTGASGSGIPRVTLSNDSTLAANQSVNTAQINGVAPTMGNGVSGTGVQRVTLASDSTGQVVLAAGAAVIGHVIVDTTSTTAVTQATASNLNAAVVGTLATNGAAAGTNAVADLPGIARSNYPSANTAGRNSAMSQDLYGVTWTGPLPTGLTTYVAAGSGTLAATPTDIATLSGNATNTVMVNSVTLSCTQTTAGQVDVILIKHSSADTSGASAAMTAVPLDSADGAAVSAPLFYTANPTRGNTVGIIDNQKIGFMAPATAASNDIYVWKPGMGETLTLRGTAQQVAVNIGGATVSGAACDVAFNWIETTGR